MDAQEPITTLQRVEPNILIYGYHTGIDLAGGTTVVAPADGIVLFKQTGCKNQGEIGYDKTCGSGYGNYVDIEFTMADNSKRYGRFGHLSNNDAAPSSGCVKQGAALGPAGKTGNVTGVHLHWAMRSNTSNWTGYTTAHPDGYGFSNPTSYYSQSFKTCGGRGSDGDGDGIPDASDRCASLRGFALWKGCRPNGLRNGSLEEGSTAGWAKLGTGTNIASYTDRATARDGDRYGATNVAVADGSIYQDVAIAAKPGESYTLSVWLRARHAAPMRGKLVLWATGGGTSVNEVETFSLTQDWQLVSVTFDSTVTRSQLRAQIYMSDTNATNTLYFDGATLSQGSRRVTIPGAVSGLTATPTATRANVSWSVPPVSGGSEVIDYAVTLSPGGLAKTTTNTSTAFTGLTASTPYAVSVRARNAVGFGPAVTFQLRTADAGPVPAGSFGALTPGRLLETRVGPNWETVDGQFEGVGRRSAGQVTEVVVADRGGVPADAGAVAVNLTVINPSARGYATLWPCGVDQPTTSSLNYMAGQTVANSAVVKVGTGGKVCIYTRQATDIVLDTTGFFPNGSFGALTPARLLESRSGTGFDTIDGQFQGVGRRSAGQVTEVVVADRGGVPADAGAVAVNLTVINPSARGYATLWPCGVDQPTTSSLNYMAGQTVANSAIVKVGTGGKLCVYTSRATDLVIDTTGHLD